MLWLWSSSDPKTYHKFVAVDASNTNYLGLPSSKEERRTYTLEPHQTRTIPLPMDASRQVQSVLANCLEMQPMEIVSVLTINLHPCESSWLRRSIISILEFTSLSYKHLCICWRQKVTGWSWWMQTIALKIFRLIICKAIQLMPLQYELSFLNM